MRYLEVDQARDLPGLRLALTIGGPGPWSEAAKAVFHVDSVSYTAVRQDSGDPNEALHAWTGHRNAPVAVFDDEPARATWSEILLLAERLSSEPCLLPENPHERVLVMGLGHEICGEQGLGWSRRILMFDATVGERARRGKPLGRMGAMASLYGFAPERVVAARRRVVTLLEMLTSRLESQRARGSDYLVGDSLSAADLYWACFAAMFAPLPQAQCPITDSLRQLYTVTDPEVHAALHPVLLEHRDGIYERHLELPLDF